MEKGAWLTDVKMILERILQFQKIFGNTRNHAGLIFFVARQIWRLASGRTTSGKNVYDRQRHKVLELYIEYNASLINHYKR